MKLNKHLHWGSHLPVLIRLMEMTEGDVLELGTGLYSTPFLHYACLIQGRKLVSYENTPEYFTTYKDYNCPWHQVIFVKDWKDAGIRRKWGLAFIDNAPEESRKDLALKIANWARVIALHDGDPKVDKFTHYSEIIPLFRKNFNYTGQSPNTLVLSNFKNTDIDLRL